ncbi:nucleotidyltransferase substrate binding protein [uncultured Sphingomonas sp.]|uniref:nucleotidyltransferase substrate binding protein n=1 Tax=uncultured Sphingomonas sp. TaxID=158754 RepID=UPI0035CC9C57
MAITRWKQRFGNYRRALSLLREAVVALRAGQLSMLEREGLIQRFEYTWELGWKVMRDYLIDAAYGTKIMVPADVIRAANETGLIKDGDGWIKAQRSRNQMAHEYDPTAFERITREIADQHLELLEDLERTLGPEVDEHDRP